MNTYRTMEISYFYQVSPSKSKRVPFPSLVLAGEGRGSLSRAPPSGPPRPAVIEPDTSFISQATPGPALPLSPPGTCYILAASLTVTVAYVIIVQRCAAFEFHPRRKS